MPSNEKDIKWYLENPTKEEKILLEEGEKVLSDDERTLFNSAMDGDKDAASLLLDQLKREYNAKRPNDEQGDFIGKAFFVWFNLAKTGNDRSIHNVVSEFYDTFRDADKADLFYRESLNTSDRDNKALYNLNLGSLLYAKKEKDNSVPYFEAALETEDVQLQISAHLMLGRYYKDMPKQYNDEALKHYSFVAENADDNVLKAQSFNNIAFLLGKDEKREEAISYYSKALEIGDDTQKGDSHIGMAFNYAKMGKKKDSKKHALAVLEIEDSSYLSKAWANTILARTSMKENPYKEDGEVSEALGYIENAFSYAKNILMRKMF
jgi:tetratricopeptide (TPR) repeat protein